MSPITTTDKPTDHRVVQKPPPPWVALAKADHDRITTDRPGMAPSLVRAWCELLFVARQQHSTAFTLPTDVCASRFGVTQRHTYNLLRELQTLGLLTVTTTRVRGRYTPLQITIHPTVDLFSRRNCSADGKGSHRRNSKGGASSSASKNTSGLPEGCVITHTHPSVVPPGSKTAAGSSAPEGPPPAASGPAAEEKKPAAAPATATPWVAWRPGGGKP